MQKILAVSKFLATLFMIFMLWIAYSLISVAYQSFDNKNLDYIPEDADFVARVDAQKLVKMSSTSVILNEDEEVVDLIKEILDQDGETKVKPLGIALNSDIILFHHELDDRRLTGVLVNLTSPNVFKRNIPKIFGDHVVTETQGSVGLAYFEVLTTPVKRLSKSKLRTKAKQILSNKSGFDLSVLGESKEKVVAQTWSRSGLLKNAGIANNTSLSFTVTERELIIDGALAFNSGEHTQLTRELVPEGMHISTNQISGLLNDTLTSLFESLHLPEAKISGVSLNYHGLELIDDPVYFPAPKFDALISFENDFSVEAAIDSILLMERSQRIGDNAISYSGLELYYKQIDSKTVYIGASKECEIMGHDSRLSTWLYGTPESITKISGSRMLRGALSMMPLFRPTENFLKGVEHLGLRLGVPKNGISEIHGVIRFKDQEYTLNSVVKFLLQAR